MLNHEKQRSVRKSHLFSYPSKFLVDNLPLKVIWNTVVTTSFVLNYSVWHLGLSNMIDDETVH